MKCRKIEHLLILAAITILLLAASARAMATSGTSPATDSEEHYQATQPVIYVVDRDREQGSSYSVILSDLDEDGDIDTFVISEQKEAGLTRSKEKHINIDGKLSAPPKLRININIKNLLRRGNLVTFSGSVDCQDQKTWLITREEYFKSAVKSLAIFTARTWTLVKKAAILMLAW